MKDAETGDTGRGDTEISPRLRVVSFFILDPSSLRLEAMKGVEPLSSGLQDRRSVIQLSYIARRMVFGFWSLCLVLCSLQRALLHMTMVELRGIEPLYPACRAGIMPLDHSPRSLPILDCRLTI